MADYKKRAKAGWSAGKSYKKESNRSERQFEKEEIKHTLHEMNQGDDFRYKHQAKKMLTPLERKKKQLNSIQLHLDRWKRRMVNVSMVGMVERLINSYNATVKKLKAQIREMKGD